MGAPGLEQLPGAASGTAPGGPCVAEGGFCRLGGVLKREEALTLEAAERNLDLERLETRERQVTQAEDDVGAREVRIQEEIDHRMAEARSALEREYEARLELIRAEAEGRTAALRAKLAEVTRHANSSAAALSAAQAELDSSRAELLIVQ